ncbi:LisH domain and HEAT repeat-containing protein KIAA1468 [Amphibalanus amphitrite]|uniref:LisH domain and HEAT repeat-containing protein KIAA1468 n=1 Tax=Amphibalanus amphitrite TaxID=1232801 RepID=A0A6A4VCC3_AMPAM|nr:LisH domain and HEAT repeat-containing protein KIAA1468 [Amphibalanus amphitrite]
MNPFLESEEPPGVSAAAAGPSTVSVAPTATSSALADDPPTISIDEIAKKLLRENFYLTALELHLELAELGAELPRLRSFFSNPGNFERQTPFKPELGGQLPRTSSQATLDSIDLGRYSEDGERLADERTALLEFELRKAHDTIKSLRANLTGATELNTPDHGGDRPITDDDPIKPHEKRALNFLINEYLLRHGYKLTSIAFSDENEDQDVEDWDDVGLNVAKPPDLLHFFREGGSRPSEPPAPPPPPTPPPGTDCECQTDEDPVHAQLQNDITALMDKIEVLESQLSAVRSFAADAAAAADTAESVIHGVSTASPAADGAGDSTASGDESLESELARTESQNRLNALKMAGREAQPPSPESSAAPERFRRAVLAACIHEQSEGAADETIERLQLEVAQLSSSPEQAVLQLARCLPHIVPNVILAKREELIPLLLSAIQLHPDVRQRDVLLNLLFNLIKRPDAQQRAVILAGFRSLVARLCPGRLEEEVLPQCWEQISHKYFERRLLVAEACAVLAPFIPPELRGSLVWSMLHQMVTDEKEAAVREAAIRSLAVVLVHCDDDDKFSQAWDLTARLLEDRCEPVQRSAAELLLPVVARWASQLGRLSDRLVPHALSAARQAAQRQPADWTVSVWIQVLMTLLDQAFLWVVSAGPHLDRVENDSMGITSDRLPSQEGPLSDLEVLHGDGRRLRHMVAAFDEYVTQEWYRVWPALEWLTNECVPELFRLAEVLPLSFPDAVYEMAALLRHTAHLVGPTIADSKLWPCCESRLRGAAAADAPPPGLTSALLPAVCAGLLAAPLPDADARLARTLEDALYLSAACRLTGEPLAAAVRLLLEYPERHAALLDLLWKGVMHSVVEVRETTAQLAGMLVPEVPETVLTARVLPALVTLASDPQQLVRRAVVPALGLVLETQPGREPSEKARLQVTALCQDAALAGPLAAALGRAAAAGRHTEFCLSRLAELSARRAPADAPTLLDAYTALACGHVAGEAVSRDVLPALRSVICLLHSCSTLRLIVILIVTRLISLAIE